MDDFLETEEWKQLSAKVRRRDGKCLRCGSSYRLCADHIIPRSRRPDLQLQEFNLQTLCKDCNYRKGATYIVSFLSQPSAQLLKEIEIEKDNSRDYWRKIALDHIFKSEQSQSNLIVSDRAFDEFQKKLYRALMPFDEEQAKREGVFNAPLNAARIFGIGFTAAVQMTSLLGKVGLDLVAKSQIPEKEVSAIVEQQVKREFSDWSNLEVFSKDRIN